MADRPQWADQQAAYEQALARLHDLDRLAMPQLWQDHGDNS